VHHHSPHKILFVSEEELSPFNRRNSGQIDVSDLSKVIQIAFGGTEV
jgi:hypothetical protein